MKQNTVWKWRIQWAGKWVTSTRLASEEEIRKEHPEAQRIEGSQQIRMEAETQAEIESLHKANTLHLGPSGTAGF